MGEPFTEDEPKTVDAEAVREIHDLILLGVLNQDLELIDKARCALLALLEGE